jgi:hypothetical protein
MPIMIQISITHLLDIRKLFYSIDHFKILDESLVVHTKKMISHVSFFDSFGN